ncbi:ferritin-like domain-containing protein [Candidatus Nephthysia bennettiae]|uniref:Twin-arginine translocation signal domain-containing protein n=1 Tax=Candidatus Nephthysia bennettiae TaxID=3127016 RepID=A0A934K687_9BACT|nr:twin-arginine translocation signal domain-containing protein [Candidatus Dormibacteraeota bacterium]MBJ7612437.1 twin-arginine translocation signal domain-containing protein [Candidatus Dormibacteraeota bacterium]
MKTKDLATDEVSTQWRRLVGRRSFLKGVGAVGATLPAGVLFATQAQAASLSKGDAAILRFLAAAEIIESDLWQQYNELGGVKGGNPAYILALQNLDGDMPQYITDNTDDELSHADFLNAYLKSRGAQPVNLDKFRTLASSAATGANHTKKRLTNLMKLNVDTSWYVRYRSMQNPDLGATFPQAVTINKEPAIPISDQDTPPGQPQPVPPANAQESRMQAIANTAGFHFAFIEQGGASLYTAMALKARDLEVLRIVISIGGVEVDHFGLWHDKAGNAVNDPLAGVTDPETGVTFPNLNNKTPLELFKTNKILPEPCDFIRKDLPRCSVIRPSSDQLAGARAAVAALTQDNLFDGQSKEFFDTIKDLADAADAAEREL